MRIAVAMSGGVDSSVAALLLRQEGHDVEGVTMALGAPTGAGERVETRAAAAARAVGVPHRIVDASAAFDRRVVSYFVSEYACGRTPNPCVACNRFLKFGLLAEDARSRGAEAFATGHYARVDRNAEGAERLLRGSDPTKDQSYFLYGLTQAQLAFSRFPLGTLTKREVRRLAADSALPCEPSAESADVCFVHDGDVAALLRLRSPEAATPGPIVDEGGRRIGTHRGYGLYTIGQRSALGLSRAAPSYVLRIVPSTNTIVVGPDAALRTDRLVARDLSWIAGSPPPSPFRARARVRYGSGGLGCTVSVEGRMALARFDEPERAVTPGQAVVFYDGDIVLGGGTIVEPGPDERGAARDDRDAAKPRA